MKKKVYLKEKVENFLTGIVLLSIAFVAMTIESIGNSTYNITLIVILIVNAIIMKILTLLGGEQSWKTVVSLAINSCAKCWGICMSRPHRRIP